MIKYEIALKSLDDMEGSEELHIKLECIANNYSAAECYVNGLISSMTGNWDYEIWQKEY